MSLKNTFQDVMQDKKKMIDVLYISSKTMFLILAFLFFSLYFSISTRFYDAWSIVFFLPVYVCFILSFCQYLSLFFWKYFYKKLPNFVLIIVSVLCVLLALVFLLPLF